MNTKLTETVIESVKKMEQTPSSLKFFDNMCLACLLVKNKEVG